MTGRSWRAIFLSLPYKIPLINRIILEKVLFSKSTILNFLIEKNLIKTCFDCDLCMKPMKLEKYKWKLAICGDAQITIKNLLEYNPCLMIQH